MFKVGLTGGIASGKSTVAAILKKFGTLILDADIAVHEISQYGTAEFDAIKKLLGPDVIANNELKKPAIRHIIFNDAAKRAALEAILHPAVRQWLINKTNSITSPYCVLVIPLLIETNMSDLSDIIAVVDCDEARQIERLMKRDQCNKETAQKMIDSQISRQQRLVAADIVINNNDSIKKLEKQVANLHNTWKRGTVHEF